MDFDLLVASVVPAALLDAVKDILVTVGLTSALASQAWEPWWFRCGRSGCRRRRRLVVGCSYSKLILEPPQRLDD